VHYGSRGVVDEVGVVVIGPTLGDALHAGGRGDHETKFAAHRVLNGEGDFDVFDPKVAIRKIGFGDDKIFSVVGEGGRGGVLLRVDDEFTEVGPRAGLLDGRGHVDETGGEGVPEHEVATVLY